MAPGVGTGQCGSVVDAPPTMATTCPRSTWQPMTSTLPSRQDVGDHLVDAERGSHGRRRFRDCHGQQHGAQATSARAAAGVMTASACDDPMVRRRPREPRPSHPAIRRGAEARAHVELARPGTRSMTVCPTRTARPDTVLLTPRPGMARSVTASRRGSLPRRSRAPPVLGRGSHVRGQGDTWSAPSPVPRCHLTC